MPLWVRVPLHSQITKNKLITKTMKNEKLFGIAERLSNLTISESKQLMDILENDYENHNNGFNYGKEEVLFSTVFFNKFKNTNTVNPYVEFFWSTFGLNEQPLDYNVINKINKGKYVSNYGFEEIFGVKRINRDINDPLRQFITNIQ